MAALQRLTWEQMQLKYPDKWVAVANYVKEGPDLLEGDLLAVLDDDEINSFRIENWGKGYYYDRTTEESGVGIIHGKDIEYTVE